MVGVGLEELGVEEFVEGKFFDGELYLDTKKESYKALGFKRIGFFGAVSSIFTGKAKELMAEAKKENMGGNLKGDGYQNGGTVVVGAGGKLLFSYSQDQPSDHAEPGDILKALGMQEKVGSGASGGAGASSDSGHEVVCEEDVCRKA